MNDDVELNPRVVVHRIPQIEVYQVADFELARLQDVCGKPSLDQTLCISSASAALGLLPAVFMPGHSLTFSLIAGVLVLGAFFFGYRAWRSDRRSQSMISSIRSRRVDPE
jgi:VIT1/CCC1 family predicted Fe2+/Mn2+ transporter